MIITNRLRKSYNFFIANANKTYKEFNYKYMIIDGTIKNIIKTIMSNKIKIKEKLNIDIMQYEKELLGIYYPEEELRMYLLNNKESLTETEDKRLLYEILENLCISLRDKSKLKVQLKVLENRKKISFKRYRELLSKYYNKVEEKMLYGETYVIDDLCNLYILKIDFNYKRVLIDKNKTSLNYNKLIREGRIPYNAKDAMEYEKKGLEYKGEHYVEYRNTSKIQGLYVTVSKYTNRAVGFEMKSIVHVDKKYETKNGKSAEVLADYFPKFEDLFNAPLSTWVKLEIIKKAFPEQTSRYRYSNVNKE